MKIRVMPLMAVVCVLLSACGGGDDSAVPLTSGRAQASSLAATTANDTILRIQVDPANANRISVSRLAAGQWLTYFLRKDNGQVVLSIDDLPEGLANFVALTDRWNRKGHLRVRMDNGTYRMNRGWVWPARLSGLDDQHQIVVEPLQANGQVILSGAQAQRLTMPSTGDRVSTSLGSARPVVLWAEGQRAIRARTPNVGHYFYVNDAVRGWRDESISCASVNVDCIAATVTKTESRGGQKVPVDVNMNKVAFQASPDSVGALQAVAADARATVVLMHSWSHSRMRPAAVQAATSEVRMQQDDFDGATVGPIMKGFGAVQRYFVENLPSALDAAGEWYVDANGTLTYLPRGAAAGSSIDLEIPLVARLLTMQGNASAGQWVQWVQFNGLKFRHTAYQEVLPNGALRDASISYSDTQAAFRVSAAIEINDARHVEINRSEVAHTGGYGIWLNRHSQSNVIDNNDIYDTGAGGVKIGIADYNYIQNPNLLQDNHAGTYAQQLADAARTGLNTVSRNRIYGTGHLFPGAAGIWIGRSNGNRVEANLIRDTTYSGISVGWDWNAVVPAIAADNLILNNFLLNIGQGVMSDLAGIYTLGNQGDAAAHTTGTRISGNVIKQVQAFADYGPKGAGIYQDEGSSWISVQGNLIDGANGVGYTTNRAANNNIVAHNAFVRVAAMMPVETLDYPARSTAESASLADVLAEFSSNVVVPYERLLQIPGGTLSLSRKSLKTEGNLLSNQLNSSLESATQCVANDPAWCVIDSQVYLATIDAADPYAIQQLVNVGSGIFQGPLAPDGSASSWRTEGARLVASGLPGAPYWSAAPYWLEQNLTERPVHRIDFEASRWPKGNWDPAGWYIENPSQRAKVVEQGNDGARAVTLASSTTAFAFTDINSGTMTIKASVFLDGTTGLTLRAQHADPAGDQVGHGPLVTFTPQGTTLKVTSNDDQILPLSMATGRWYEITMVSPVKTNPTFSVTVRAMSADASSGRLTPGALVGSTNVSTSTNWSKLGRLAIEVGSTTGQVRVGAVSISRN